MQAERRPKEWNKAKLVLHKIIGDKPLCEEDPRRMQANQFFIQIVNNNGEQRSMPLGDVRALNDQEKKELIDNLYQPIDDAQAEEIMQT